MAEGLIHKKKEIKVASKEAGDRLRSELQNLENQLFTTKVETESLKIDKKYYEEQVSELARKNQDLKANIESIKSDTASNQAILNNQEDRPSTRSVGMTPHSNMANQDALSESNQRLMETLSKTVEQNNQLIEENTLLNQHLE